MKGLYHPITAIGVCIAAYCCVAKVHEILTFLDFFEKPSVHHDEACVKVMSIGASEDQTQFNSNSIVMTEWRATGYHPGEEKPPGALYVSSGFKQGTTAKSAQEFVENNLKIQELPIFNYPENIDFHPHGMYIRKEDSTLYVINHAYENGGERIDVFGVGTADDGDDDTENDIPNRLDYQYSITSDWMNNDMHGILNSLIVVEKNKFYVTQYLPIPERHDGWLSFERNIDIERFKTLVFGKRGTYVWYCEYDDESGSLDCRKVADQFIGANGITHNEDYSKIFVGDYFTINVFDRDASSNELQNRTTIDVPNFVDNLKFDKVSGNVYGGTINNLWYTVFVHPFPAESEQSTSGIMELAFDPQTSSWQAREIISSSKLNAISNGLKMGEFYVMGAGGLGYPGLLVCPVIKEAGQSNTGGGKAYDSEL
ncbi:unnamed protein product [Pseudo-nitzschia multistriata]|uniref:Glucose/Sorbosone dehydrogenase domain-containing protein n=1 Tax=Pseudo-nitzschia multistriata TaxID=183589 RepID=A0A448Z0G3_9STRA|nr:unnamed protein product [Pseudo-nitzschia multistriata]